MMPVKKLCVAAILSLMLLACRKESFTDSPSATLTTTVDSLNFDTVFTSAGSTTRIVKIINSNRKSIRVSSIRLAGGASSPFRININGSAGPVVNDLELSNDDSAYIFVTVNINPSAGNLAFVVRDSIEISYNGNRQMVQLSAYGQNAHFFRSRKVTGNEVWTNDLPYVILDGIVVDTNATLRINEGVKVYMHGNAPFIVHGSLQVNGNRFDSTKVVFSGDRLDLPYRNYPAAYPGLVFSEASKNNNLNYTVIRNAYQGIVATGNVGSPKLTLNETIIDNAYDAGLLGINTNLVARNLQVSNCGKNILLVKGGAYTFRHCTVAAYSNEFIQHRDPAVVVTNYLAEGNQISVNPLTANFQNCILWGEANGFVDNEVVVLKEGNSPVAITFDQVLWRVKNNPAPATIAGEINGLNPMFDSVNNNLRIYNFNLKSSSPALNKGNNSGVNLDIRGLPRPVGLPDLGAYERQ